MGLHRGEGRVGILVENDVAEDRREDREQAESVDDHETIALMPCELEGGDYRKWNCGYWWGHVSQVNREVTGMKSKAY